LPFLAAQPPFLLSCLPDRPLFSVLSARFASMVADMPDSFLITPSWRKVKARVQ